MTALQEKLINEISKNPNLSNGEYAALIGSTAGSVKNMIITLRSRGALQSDNTVPGERRKEIKLLLKPEIKETSNVSEMIRKVLKSGQKITAEQLSDQLDIGISKVIAGLQELKEQGFNISGDNSGYLLTNLIPKSEPTNLSVKKMSTGLYRFGVCGDNHLGSKYERMDILNALYDYYEQQGITTVYNTGNWIDGEARFNKHDIHTHGLDNQVDYFIQNYPQRKGITTYFISGDDHEGWYTQREGIDIGYYAQTRAKKIGRNDLVYIGHMEADVILQAPNGKTTIRVQHPGGGSAYAISYTSQKIVESFTGAEKPDILLIGHYHKAEYIYVRGVHVVQTAATQDQTPFMRKKRLAAHLGGWDIEFNTDDNGAVTRFRSEYLPFYDKQYYKNWEYKR